jgi:tetratricopeptide (TPR) repeat protein
VKISLRAGLLVFLVSIAQAQSSNAALEQANAALQAGEADKAISLLNSLPESAESHNLRCRVFFALEHWEEAASDCEQAVNLNPRDSRNHLWLGRAMGEKADHASFITAYSLAKRSRAEFEEAVSLSPYDAEALADLGEFYTLAPGIVGGGNEKAEGLLPQLERADPAGEHELRARIAESRKDYEAAERQLKLAIHASEHPSSQWMALGSFYRKHEHWDEMEKAVQSGYKAAQQDKQAGVALFNGASVLMRGGRNLALAAKMLEEYLATYSKTEEAPAFEAHTHLAAIKAQLGDQQGARQEQAAALKLAHDYQPALAMKF